jgi:hypothetical protein
MRQKFGVMDVHVLVVPLDPLTYGFVLRDSRQQ